MNSTVKSAANCAGMQAMKPVELKHMNSNDTTQPVCFLELDPQLSLLRRGAAEFTGTLLLVLVLLGSKLHALQALTASREAAGLMGAVAAGGALAGLILALGVVSGGHFNPLITILQWMSHLRSGKCAVVYVVAQLAGGIAGAILATTVFGAISVSGGSPAPGRGWMLAELLSSAGLMVVVFGCMRSGRKEFGPLGAGAWLTGSVIGLPATFANPALALGAEFALGTGALMTWHALRIALLMEIVGAFLAAAVLGLLFPKELVVAHSLWRPPNVENTAAS
jgi:glycerol uptake facilitator-like aquaporin